MGVVTKDKLRIGFEVLLEERQEALFRAVRRNDRAGKLVSYGNICGLLDAMEFFGAMDRGRVEHLKSETWSVCTQGVAKNEDTDD